MHTHLDFLKYYDLVKISIPAIISIFSRSCIIFTTKLFELLMCSREIKIHPVAKLLRNIKSHWKIKLSSDFLLSLCYQLREIIFVYFKTKQRYK